MRISFDFDGCLDKKDIQEFAKGLIKKGHELWVITSRYSYDFVDPIEVMKEIGIMYHRCIFTSHSSKLQACKDLKIDIHIDDDWIIIDELMDNGINAVSCENEHWKENILDFIKKDSLDYEQDLINKAF